MIRVLAIAVLLASAAPAWAQVAQPDSIPAIKPLPGMNMGRVNRVIPGTPSLKPSIVNPITNHPINTEAAHLAMVRTPAPMYRNGIAAPISPSLGSANRTNGIVGQGAISGVTAQHGVRAIGSGPLNQQAGAERH